MILFRFKLLSIASRWASQITRAPKFTYGLRKYYYTAEWNGLIEKTFRFTESIDAMLGRFYTRDFTTSNLSQKLYWLQNQFSDALRANFDGEPLTKMLRGFRNTPKIKDFLMRGTIEMLNLDFSDATKNDPARFQRTEQIISMNLGRDLPLCPAEDIFNVRPLTNN